MDLKYIIYGFIVIFMIGCGEKNPLLVDTYNIKADITIKRYEQFLFEIDLGNLKNELNEHKNEYAFFIGNSINNPVAIQELIAYLSDPIINKLYQDTKSHYPNLNFLNSDLEKAFKYYKYYYKDIAIPAIYTYISGVDYANKILYADSVIIIGLDNYLGKAYYKNYQVPEYQSQTMTSEYIKTDCMYKFGIKHAKKFSKNHLLSQMMYYGKVMYFLDAVMPLVADSIKIGYTQKQIAWCKSSEWHMWSYLIDHKLLYEKNHNKINKLLEPAPFTAFFPKQSPGRTGVWIGWQIIRQYMKNNPQITLQELMSETDVQKVFLGAKYNPQK